MRGGTANCSVVMSDRPVGSPVIATADCLIVMNKPSVAKFIGMVKKDGVVLVNSSLIEDKIERTDVKVYYIPANELAHKAKTEGLTEEEIIERDRLRQEYLAAFRQNLRAQLDNTYLVDDHGNKRPLKPKHTKKH